MSAQATLLRNLPASRIVAAVAYACARWADADFPPRIRATRAVMERLNYSEPVVDYALDRLFAPVNAEALRDVIDDEIGSLDALDGFAKRRHRPDAFARGVDRVTVISSDTTIGVALWPALFALCAKCDVTVKDRSDALLSAFAQTLYEEDGSFEGAFRAEHWESQEAPYVQEQLRNADTVIAFGRTASLALIRERCGSQTLFYGFGHRTSVSYLDRESLTNADLREVARKVARDALLYDGEGCLSTHAVFIETGGAVDPAGFQRALHAACAETAIEFPPVRTADPLAQRDRTFFAAAQVEPANAHPSDYAIAFDPPRAVAPPLDARSLALYPLEQPAEALGFLREHGVPLEAFALVDPSNARPDALAAALESGASRVARVGDLQSPDLRTNHGGAGRVLPFVRWIARDA